MPGFHAKLSPSAAHRWRRCPGSVREESKLSQDNSSSHAAEGTVFHSIIEKCLTDDLVGLEPADFLGQQFDVDGHAITVDEDMVRYATAGIDSVEEQEGDLYVETKVSLSTWLPDDADENGETAEQFGTLDIALVSEETITVWDWKYGRGVPVSPFENDQLVLYALGFWDTVAKHVTKATQFRIVIDQPRNPDGGGEWLCSLDTLLRIGEDIAADARATLAPDAPKKAGPVQCKFCSVRPACDEFARYNLDLMSSYFEDLTEEGFDLPDTDGMTPERRSFVALRSSMIQTWLDDLKGRVLNDAIQGEPTPGAKAVRGKAGARKWADEDEAEKSLKRHLGKKKAFVEKLISPTQAEKLLSTQQWERARKNITQNEPKPLLVDETDSREPIQPAVGLFEDETQAG